MIALISGKYIPAFGRASPGLDIVETRLSSIGKRVQRFTWAARPPLITFDPSDEPIVLIGHSYGGFTAYVAAWDLNHFRPAQPITLILLDPVCWDADLTDGLQESFLAQWQVNQINPTSNVVRACCLLCSAADPIRNCHLIGDPAIVSNETIGGTDHNSVITDNRSLAMIEAITRESFSEN